MIGEPQRTKGRGSRAAWAQPSLSRDFALLTAAILFTMLMISAWVAWITYLKHSDSIIAELRKETDRIENTLESEVQNTGYLLTAIGKQISYSDTSNLPLMAQRLKSFASGNPSYALWSWSDPTLRIVVSSNRGVLDTPVDVSDRDYIQQGQSESWVMHIGVPIEGRASGKWVVPIGLGINDQTGKFLGTLTASVDIGALTERISGIVKREGISFSIVSKSFVPLTTVADSAEFVTDNLPLQRLQSLDTEVNREGLMSRARLFSGKGMYSYYRVSEDYPYIIVVAYDAKASDSAIRGLLWPRLIQVMVVAGFLLIFLWIIRARVINPVIELAGIAADVAAGREYHVLSHGGPQEIEQLSTQVARIGDFISERRKLEEELRDKIFILQQRYQKLQRQSHQRAGMLAGLLSDQKNALRSINGYAQVLKDQLYGPIENKKYHQYAADIHQQGTMLGLSLRKLTALARLDAAALVVRQEEVRLFECTEQARRFVAELAPEGLAAPPLENAIVPETAFCGDMALTQQAIAYLLLYLAARQPAPSQLTAAARLVASEKGKEQLMAILGSGESADIPDRALLQAVPLPDERLDETSDLQDSLHLALAKALLRAQQIDLLEVSVPEGGYFLLLRIPPNLLAE